jgi:hypothetical protein
MRTQAYRDLFPSYAGKDEIFGTIGQRCGHVDRPRRSTSEIAQIDPGSSEGAPERHTFLLIEASELIG